MKNTRNKNRIGVVYFVPEISKKTTSIKSNHARVVAYSKTKWFPPQMALCPYYRLARSIRIAKLVPQTQYAQ